MLRYSGIPISLAGNDGKLYAPPIYCQCIDRYFEKVSEEEINHASSGEEARLNEDLSSSLEDLVGNFDERISSCLKNPDVNTEDIAPVQVRTQDEVMAESQ
ncbi:hypothetical protein NECAME_00398 [Necator americanus]|uniref:Uncharacterized protein n=1 Tax=Necator americanus TaxID=51031 RepID=W2TDC7_NECAM|nr:hypothetical protein NECAME_00398 [Necator americanus]ETN79022.1 hypothetical protein NECAME_00398 [Necator americanus]